MAHKITKEELNKVKYHELQEKFEELGIGDVWKAGKKKNELINEALARLEKIKELEAQGIKKEDITKKIEIDANKEQAEIDREDAKAAEQKKAESKAKAEFYKERISKLPKDLLEKRYKTILRDLKNNPSKEVFDLLIFKRDIIEKVLG